MKINFKKQLGSFILVFAGLGIIFYFLHVILGTINYPGYDSFHQAVSDLTSDDSPAKTIARTMSGFYGVFSSLVAIGLIMTFRKDNNKLLKLGIICLGVMYLVSAIGYALFPLSSSNNISDFQNIMHIVVTGLVVFLTVLAIAMLIISFYRLKLKIYFLLSVITFLMLMLGAILTNVVSIEYFGLVERFSVFSVVIYLGIIAYFNYEYHNKEGVK
jgi:hypothetical protein